MNRITKSILIILGEEDRRRSVESGGGTRSSMTYVFTFSYLRVNSSYQFVNKTPITIQDIVIRTSIHGDHAPSSKGQALGHCCCYNSRRHFSNFFFRSKECNFYRKEFLRTSIVLSRTLKKGASLREKDSNSGPRLSHPSRGQTTSNASRPRSF